MMKYFTVILMLFFSVLTAVEHLPWFSIYKQIASQGSYEFKHSGSIEDVKLNENEHILSLDLSFSPSTKLCGSTRIDAGYNTKGDFFFDEFSLTGQRLWYNDIVGDTLSFATGITARFHPKKALKNISRTHYCSLESEFTLYFGKELTERAYWSSRYWANIALGSGNSGSPWIRSYLAAEKNIQPLGYVRLFCESGQGLGKKDFDSEKFNGYANLRHTFLKTGIKYTHHLPAVGKLYVGYTYTPYGKNYPKQDHSLYISFLYPIDLVPTLEEVSFI
jgi:hypothetical protein